MMENLPVEILHYYIIPFLDLEERGYVVRKYEKYEEFLVKNRGCWKECFKKKFSWKAVCEFGLIRVLERYSGKQTIGKNSLYEATKNGHLDVVKWLYGNRRKDIRTKRIKRFAVVNGHLDIVKWYTKIDMHDILVY